MSRLRRMFADRDESGVTILEVIIYGVLSVVVAGIVASVFINTVRSQEQVTSIADATTKGQYITQSIERALRNAQAVSIENGGATIKVLTTLGSSAGDVQRCQAWRVSGSNLQVSQGIGFSSWRTVATGVGTISGAPYFARPSATVDYALSFATAGAPVQITGGIVPRAAGGSLGTSCS